MFWQKQIFNNFNNFGHFKKFSIHESISSQFVKVKQTFKSNLTHEKKP